VRIQRSVQNRSERKQPDEAYIGTVDPLLQSVPGLSNDITEVPEDPYRRPVYATSEELKPKPHFKQIGDSPFKVKSDLSITNAIKIIGSDQDSTAIHIDHPSISPRHAQVRITPSGSVGLADMRSSTGTWVNYAPISTKGIILKNGDLVKFGAFTFRYYLGLNNGENA